MRKLFTAIALAASLGTAQAALLTFEDVPGGSIQDTLGAMPVPASGYDYMGFTFACTGGFCDFGEGYNNLSWLDSVGPGSWEQGAVSGDFVVKNYWGGVGVVRAANGSDFTFDGVWAREAHAAGPRAMTISGFNNGIEVWAQTGTLSDVFVNFGAMAGAIDELRIDAGDGFFLIDDLALNERGATVPEPASILLAGLGLAALRARRLGGPRRAR